MDIKTTPPFVFTLGFIFSPRLDKVILCSKPKGPFKGYWNGVGGQLQKLPETDVARMVSEFETPLACLQREFQEETGMSMEWTTGWQETAILRGAAAIDPTLPEMPWGVYVFATRSNFMPTESYEKEEGLRVRAFTRRPQDMSMVTGGLPVFMVPHAELLVHHSAEVLAGYAKRIVVIETELKSELEPLTDEQRMATRGGRW